MISILICGYNPQFEKEIKSNIHETIGCEHEVLYFKNTEKRGLAEVYNLLKVQAKGEIVCFVHEDVEFMTKYWGKEVNKIFSETQNIGILGIAGGKYVSKNFIAIKQVQHLIQGYKSGEKQEIYLKRYNNDLEPVINLDGVLLIVNKEVALKFDFDEKVLKGFHGYDIDFCLQVSQSYQNYFTSKVLIKHFSEGNFTPDWKETLEKLRRKWQDRLPFFTKGLSYLEREFYEYKIYWAGIQRIGGLKYAINYFRGSFIFVYFYKKIFKSPL